MSNITRLVVLGAVRRREAPFDGATAAGWLERLERLERFERLERLERLD